VSVYTDAVAQGLWPRFKVARDPRARHWRVWRQEHPAGKWHTASVPYHTRSKARAVLAASLPLLRALNQDRFPVREA
jgi:hypothetical protein